ncbi:hypothetical protein V6Z12_D06G155900 [Gossypium hirsutum]
MHRFRFQVNGCYCPAPKSLIQSKRSNLVEEKLYNLQFGSLLYHFS